MENYTMPKVGDIIYVDSELYLSRGEDDIKGGQTRVASVGGPYGERMLTVEIVPDEYRGWDGLAEQQEALKHKFGDSWARKNPDHRPEFN